MSLLRLALATGIVALLCGCSSSPRRAPAVPDDPDWAYPGDTSCSFPPEADAAKIDAASVVLRVWVRSDGSPEQVQMIEEPGFGFGPAATLCAMSRTYVPATDEHGEPTTGWTPRIRVRFVR